MKIAVSYENGQVFQHFGHSAQFKFYETEGHQILSTVVLSTNGQGHGALVGFLVQHGANIVLCGGIGAGAQNALAQARQFAEVADITGIILTKMDGTAKGGIAVAIQSELGIPVKYIGVGETIDDLQKFDSGQFVNALFDVKEDSGEEGETEC